MIQFDLRWIKTALLQLGTGFVCMTVSIAFIKLMVWVSHYSRVLLVGTSILAIMILILLAGISFKMINDVWKDEIK